MYVDILKLTDYVYNDTIEPEIQNLLSSIIGLNAGKISEGYNPRYDFYIGNLAVELKITRKFKPLIEIQRADERPSGITLSTSDLYCIISQAKSKSGNDYVNVYKCRLYKTSDLRQYILSNSSNTIKYASSDKGPGSINVEIDPKVVPHIWLGDFKNITSTGFYTESFVKSYGNQFNQHMRELREESWKHR